MHETFKPISLPDWLWLPFHIFIVVGTFLVILPLALVASISLALTGFGTVWGKRYFKNREIREGINSSELTRISVS